MDMVADQIDYLVKVGALKLEDDIYSLDENLLREHCPELWDLHVASVDAALLEMFEEGLFNLEYDTNLEAIFSPTDKLREMVADDSSGSN